MDAEVKATADVLLAETRANINCLVSAQEGLVKGGLQGTHNDYAELIKSTQESEGAVRHWENSLLRLEMTGDFEQLTDDKDQIPAI